MTLRSRWERAHARDLVDRITVQTRRGGPGAGPSWAAAVTVVGAARGERTLVRADDGEESVAELTLKLGPTLTPVDADGEPAGPPVPDVPALFAPGSRVTALGYTGTVLTAKAARYRGRLERIDVTVG